MQVKLEGQRGLIARLRSSSELIPAVELDDEPRTKHLLLKQNLRPGFKLTLIMPY